MDSGLWIPRLSCHLLAAKAVTDTLVHAVVPDGEYPDMQGAVEVARRICPGVKEIVVWHKTDGIANHYYQTEHGWLAQ